MTQLFSLKLFSLKSAFLGAGLLALAACGGESTETAKAADVAPTAAEAPAEVAATETDTAPQQSVAPEGALESLTDGTQEMFLGDANAKVEIMEFASVTCPGCAYFHETIYKQLKTDFIDTDKIKFTYREFPTGPQQLSYAGSILARCAADKKGTVAYFAFNDQLFANQRRWVGEDFKTELLKYAAQADIDEAGFNECIARQDLLDAVNANVKAGQEEFEVNSTPTVFLNGERMTYDDYDDFKEQVEKALAAAQ